jgi:cytochrome b6-f complex iron-sulfur subunit
MAGQAKDNGRPIERRRFLNWFSSGGIAVLLAYIIYPVLRFVIPPKAKDSSLRTVKAATVEEMVPNSGKLFRFGNSPAILIDTPGGDLRSFTAVCIHLGCTVQYRKDLRHIWCACHNGHYDLNGNVISGPPPRPLERYNVAVKGDDIFVSKTKS